MGGTGVACNHSTAGGVSPVMTDAVIRCLSRFQQRGRQVQGQHAPDGMAAERSTCHEA